VTCGCSFSVSIGLAWAISLIANLLKKGADMMLSLDVMDGDALARGQACLCPCIVADQNIEI